MCSIGEPRGGLVEVLFVFFCEYRSSSSATTAARSVRACVLFGEAKGKELKREERDGRSGVLSMVIGQVPENHRGCRRGRAGGYKRE